MPATDWIVEIVKILVVPLIVSWAATRLGVRRGLEQAKRERAFDRSLEWHKNAIRAMTLFSDIAFNLTNEWASRKELDETLKRLRIHEERTIDLERALEESVLFADRKTVLKLREDIFALDTELIVRIRDAREPNDIEEVIDLAVAFARGFRKLAFSLSQEIGGKLDLEQNEEDDLKIRN